MTDPRIPLMREQKRKERSSLIWYDIRRAKTGRVGADSTDRPNVGLSDVYVWTHGEDNRPEVPALHCGRVSLRTSNAEILVGNRWADGELEVITLDGLLASLHYGGAIGALATPTVPTELQPFGTKNREFYAIPDPDFGGLYVYVYPGWYNGAYWPGGRIQLTPTATSSRKAAVLLGFDEVTGALVQGLGSDYGLAYTPDPGGAFGTDLKTTWDGAAFLNARPVAYAVLANGTTTVTGTDLVDIRDWSAVSGSGADTALGTTTDDVSNPPTAAQLTTALPDAAADGAGYAALVNDAGTRTREYLAAWDGFDWWHVPLVRAAMNGVVAGTVALTASGYNGDEWPNGLNNILSKTIDGVTYQLTAFYEADDELILKRRVLPNGAWTTWNTGITITEDDLHNYAQLGIDRDGTLHLAWDMHNDPLNYRRTVDPIPTSDGTLTSDLDMLGTSAEDDVTYPTFFNDNDGVLYFMFRGSGGSGDANWYLYVYDETSATWNAAVGAGDEGLFFDGVASDKSAYPSFPVFDRDGLLHLAWCWRDTTDWNTNADIAYAKGNLSTGAWTQADGTAQTVPITQANDAVARTIASGDFLLNNPQLAIDRDGFPQIAYLQGEGAAVPAQIHLLGYDGASWTDQIVSENTTVETVMFDEVSRPQIAIDRLTNTAYIFGHSDDLGDGLFVYISAPDDFTSWTTEEIYNVDSGTYEPFFDREAWARSGIFYLVVAEWQSAGGSHDVTLITWLPKTTLLANSQRVVWGSGTKTACEALTSTATEIVGAYATDTEEFGLSIDGGRTWTWFSSGTGETVKVSANDTTAGYLNGKLVAGTGISLSENTDGGNETLTIANTSQGSEWYVMSYGTVDDPGIVFADGSVVMVEVLA